MNSQYCLGHRKRLKERFLQSIPGNSLPDYELLELLLFHSIKRQDVKPIAKDLLKQFTTLTNVIYAEKDKLMSIPMVSNSVCIPIFLVKEFIHRILAQKVMNQHILSSWSSLLEYLKMTIGKAKIEQFRILFLNKKNIVIADELHGTGTVDQTPVYPREIVKRALFHEASAIILVHNHPSGIPKPSAIDIEITQKIVEACKTFSIVVHDHVIICSNDFFSFKSNLLL
ncbi:DNA repair RadC family protein [Orientia chuto str. Dubai]|uniref:DNA repair RadC family protein n=1 Tax=Orientia chuto str. Dubai TaxID=1359168 RepID=A0A0F3MPP6_9RICK|nr:DNA repair protein RadC [Candidatus Orientia mediorientalis]KJV56559.1 DNA repair RadC family protein [Orientia chuto str. Dubai]